MHALRILEAHCSPVGIDPTGYVLDGFLRVSGVVVQATVVVTFPASNIRQMSRSWPKELEEMPNATFFVDATQGESICQTGDVILCICCALKEGGVYSLVLKRSSSADDSYERIGCFPPLVTGTKMPAQRY